MNSLFSDIGNWCSIIGLVISIITIIYAKSIKNHVSDIQNRILYNMRLQVYLEKFRDANYKFSCAINSVSPDKNEIKEQLKELESFLKLMNKIVPKDQQKSCSKCLSTVSKQYKGRMSLTKADSEKRIYSYVRVDDLKNTYMENSALITILTNLKIDNDIIS